MDAIEICFTTLFGLIAAGSSFGLAMGIVQSSYPHGRRTVKIVSSVCIMVAAAALVMVMPTFFQANADTTVRSFEAPFMLMLRICAAVAAICFLLTSVAAASNAASDIKSWLSAAKLITENEHVLFATVDLDKDGVISEMDLRKARSANIGPDTIPGSVLSYLSNYMSTVGHEVGFGGKTTVYVIGRADVQTCHAKHQELYKRWLS